MDHNGENTLYVWANRLINCVMVSILWLLCCIPVITIGASTAALYNTVHRSVLQEQESVWECFTKTFRQRFKKCTKYWLIMLLLLVFFFVDWCATYVAKRVGNPLGGMNILCVIAMALILLWSIFLFCYLARFPKDKGHILKNSFFMMVGYLPQAVLIAAVTAVLVVLVMWQAVCLFFAPALVAICCEKLMEPMFRRIMTPEERKQEEEEAKEE